MIVLDASAALASIFGEAGHAEVDALLATQPCAISGTCASEVLARLMREGASLAEAQADLFDLELIELPFDDEVRDMTALLESRTRGTGTSFVDRSCIATGIVHDSLVITGDRDWVHLDIPEADIRLVR